VPVKVNDLPLQALKWIPGISVKIAAKIAGARPLAGIGEFRSIAGKTPIDHLLSFTSPSVQ
jgi:radical SAM superfamily enzyme with C-terminal helix-hairpin-helix motif